MGLEAASALLVDRGAGGVAHPGGTLLEHLFRVHTLLGEWGARAELRLAGLCHAFYGTDGFAVSLGAIERRGELVEVVGVEVERLVYLYASCDRSRTYPTFAQAGGMLIDRFGGVAVPLTVGQRRDLAELTVANELDVMRAVHRSDDSLLDLFVSWSSLLSFSARQAVRDALR
ncbi:DUF6817 domain-containing protein [Actinomadura algeriensis]|uniref:DUF6817 domain-containing protein n=1 Tax=Actinomadura algeriensis TaxID=1679523 RepID=UPI00384EC59F